MCSWQLRVLLVHRRTRTAASVSVCVACIALYDVWLQRPSGCTRVMHIVKSSGEEYRDGGVVPFECY